MLKHIALVGLFSAVSLVSAHLPARQAEPMTPSTQARQAWPVRLPRVDPAPMRGGPCLPGIPRC